MEAAAGRQVPARMGCSGIRVLQNDEGQSRVAAPPWTCILAPPVSRRPAEGAMQRRYQSPVTPV